MYFEEPNPNISNNSVDLKTAIIHFCHVYAPCYPHCKCLLAATSKTKHNRNNNFLI